MAVDEHERGPFAAHLTVQPSCGHAHTVGRRVPPQAQAPGSVGAGGRGRARAARTSRIRDGRRARSRIGSPRIVMRARTILFAAALAPVLGAGGVAPAGAAPSTISSCTTAALQAAVAAGGEWVFTCNGT